MKTKTIQGKLKVSPTKILQPDKALMTKRVKRKTSLKAISLFGDKNN